MTDLRQWALDQLPIPTAHDIMVESKYRDILNGITEALDITRYRAAKLVQLAIISEGYTY